MEVSLRLKRREFLFALGAGVSAAASKNLLEKWQEIARASDGTVGAAALHLNSGQLVSMNGDEKFPLASVCKLPIAMHLLALVDEGKMALDQEIEVLPRDVWSGVSDIAKRWPAQRRFPLNELIAVMVSHSDNTAVETLYRMGCEGGAMAARFLEWKTQGVRIDRSERQCSLDRNGVEHPPPADQWTDALIDSLIERTPLEIRYRATLAFLKDPRDTGTPNGTAQLLARAFRGDVLSKPSTTRLIDVLKATTSFPTRLKGLLPPGTVVAHKTGSKRHPKRPHRGHE